MEDQKGEMLKERIMIGRSDYQNCCNSHVFCVFSWLVFDLFLKKDVLIHCLKRGFLKIPLLVKSG